MQFLLPVLVRDVLARVIAPLLPLRPPFALQPHRGVRVARRPRDAEWLGSAREKVGGFVGAFPRLFYELVPRIPPAASPVESSVLSFDKRRHQRTLRFLIDTRKALPEHAAGWMRRNVNTRDMLPSSPGRAGSPGYVRPGDSSRLSVQDSSLVRLTIGRNRRVIPARRRTSTDVPPTQLAVLGPHVYEQDHAG